MRKKSIFEKAFLDAYLAHFKLSTIDGLETKREMLNDWFQAYKSGKLPSQNETSIGADFINDIFGDILGYNYRNPRNWNLEKELKTLTDGKKPDGVLGYFNLNEESSKGVHAIIELKDANTNLDAAQKRQNNKQTPIEQAFSYAPKFEDRCKWVIVSNFLEIRLYQASNANQFELFTLEELQKEDELKRFFFLLQKEHLLIKKGTSRIERLIEKSKEIQSQKKQNVSSHILDKIYNLLIKFNGLAYINPNIIANAKPFNNTNEYVWHYSKFTLQSSEEGIFDLFNQIKVESQKITISKQLKEELQHKGVVEYQKKIEFIIQRLNNYLVFNIECYEDIEKVKDYINRGNVIGASLRSELNDYAGQLRKFSIDFTKHDHVCNCLKCCYNRLDFTTVFKNLKTREGSPKYYTLETAYFHYILGTNNFKASYLIYKNIAEQEKGKNEFRYFIAKFNTYRLHNLIESNYVLEDRKEIMDSIKAIDLDLLLHELDVIDLDKRKALIELKEETVKSKITKLIDEKITSLKKVKASFERGSNGLFPNYTFQLNQPLASFSSHYAKNYILGDTFRDYKSLCKKIIEGYLISYSTHEAYKAHLKQFETYHINILLFNLFPASVKQLFKDHKIDKILISEKARKDLIEKTKNFLHANHGDKIWSDPLENQHLTQALTNYHFKQIYRHIFSNLFFLLNKVELNKEDSKDFISILIDFLKIEINRTYIRFEELAEFILSYGDHFTYEELIDILKISIQKGYLFSNDFIKSICFSIHEFYPNLKITDEVLIQKVILTIKIDQQKYEYLVPFWTICNDSNKVVVEKTFIEELDTNFAPYLYRKLLFNKIIDVDFKDYFNKHIKHIDKTKGTGAYKLWNGEPELNNLTFINFTLLIYGLDIDPSDTRIQQLSKLCDWQEWVINLENFDYSKFKSEWILIYKHEFILKRFGQVPQLRDKVKEALKEEYHERLAEIYIKYLA